MDWMRLDTGLSDRAVFLEASRILDAHNGACEIRVWHALMRRRFECIVSTVCSQEAKDRLVRASPKHEVLFYPIIRGVVRRQNSSTTSPKPPSIGLRIDLGLGF